MPIEIKELIIRAVVGTVGDGGGSEAGGAAAGPAPAGEKQETVIQDCLEMVSQILREREER